MNRLLSWNIAGIKSAVKKELGKKLKILNAGLGELILIIISWIKSLQNRGNFFIIESPKTDVILLQETKTWAKTRPPDSFLEELSEWPHTHFLDCQVVGLPKKLAMYPYIGWSYMTILGQKWLFWSWFVVQNRTDLHFRRIRRFDP